MLGRASVFVSSFPSQTIDLLHIQCFFFFWENQSSALIVVIIPGLCVASLVLAFGSKRVVKKHKAGVHHL
jgi:hypothetical protein